MDGSRSKALLTSLILFIVLGLYSLTTLFTVLLLDLRSGQDEIVHQLSTLPSPPPPSVLDQTHRDDLNLNKL